MDKKSEQKGLRQLRQNLFSVLINLMGLALFICVGLLIYGLFGDQFSLDFNKPVAVVEPISRNVEEQEDKIVDGIHLESGLVVAEGFELVRSTCTACHSGKLVTQNRADREGWRAMIKWMQETQGLWELGANEEKILNYLAANYAPQAVGRRANLEEVEWYILEDE